MLYAVGTMDIKSMAKGIEATDMALKTAGIRLVTAHPSCPGKFELVMTGELSDVQIAMEKVRDAYATYVTDWSLMGRIDEQVIRALFGSQEEAPKGALGVIETFSSSSAIKAADIAVKTAKVSLHELRVSRGMGGKGLVMITGEVADVTAACEAGGAHAKEQGLLVGTSVIASPHEELWEQL